MRVLKKQEDLMVELKPEFQRQLFAELLMKHKRNILSKKIGRASSILYHYKNNRVRSIPKVILEKALKLSDYSKQEVSRNIVKTYSTKESIIKILQEGAKIRHKKIKEELSIKFGAYSLLRNNHGLLFLDVQEWLKKNSWINKLNNQKGIVHTVKIDKISNEIIIISYYAYNRNTKKYEHYSVCLPKFLQLTLDFYYFLGLLYGDGLNGARVGIVNQNKEIIAWASSFLRKYFKSNKIKGQLNAYQKSFQINLNELHSWLKNYSDESIIYQNPSARGTHVFCIFIVNKILRRILDDFLENLENLFKKLSFEQKGNFLAGFFDAEGNVNKLDRNLRFSQKIKIKVKTIQNILENERYHIRYDGDNIIIGFKKEYKADLELFKKQILPYLKHSKKAKGAKELIKGYLVREEYKPILKIILENPEATSKTIAEMVDRVKCQPKLSALYNAGFVNRQRNHVDESFKYSITDKGLKYLGEN